MVDHAFTPEAVELGHSLRRTFESLGGIELARRAQVDWAGPTDTIERRLDALGVWELKPAADDIQLQAAALSCREAGRVALPYPVAERLTAQLLGEGDAVAWAAPAGAAGSGALLTNLVDDWFSWSLLTADGRLHTVSRVDRPAGSRLGPFVVRCEADGVRPAPAGVPATALVFGAYTLLGVVERAYELTCEHVRSRVQFGRALVEFQAVQHQLADVLVAIQRAEALAVHSLWSLSVDPASALVDAVGLRSTLLDSADVVFRAGHQLHGASGFCDETPISWLSRHSQPLRRLPTAGPATDAWLARLAREVGVAGLFAGSSR